MGKKKDEQLDKLRALRAQDAERIVHLEDRLILLEEKIDNLWKFVYYGPLVAGAKPDESLVGETAEERLENAVLLWSRGPLP